MKEQTRQIWRLGESKGDERRQLRAYKSEAVSELHLQSSTYFFSGLGGGKARLVYRMGLGGQIPPLDSSTHDGHTLTGEIKPIHNA